MTTTGPDRDRDPSAAPVSGRPSHRILVPTGIAGVNEWAVPSWWTAGRSAELRSAGGRRAVGMHPGPAVLLDLGPSEGSEQPPAQPADSTVLLIGRPLADWLPDDVIDAVRAVKQWTGQVIGWAATGRTHLLISRAVPESVDDLLAAAAGADPLIGRPDSGNPPPIDPSPIDPSSTDRAAAAFAHAVGEFSGQDPDPVTQLGSRAAVRSVIVSTSAAGRPYRGRQRRLVAAVDDLDRRLQRAGVRVHGIRAGLAGPNRVNQHDQGRGPGPDGDRLPLSTAADAALAALLAPLEDPGAIRTGPQAERRHPESAALRSRGAEPSALRSLPTRRLIRMLLGGAR